SPRATFVPARAAANGFGAIGTATMATAGSAASGGILQTLGPDAASGDASATTAASAACVRGSPKSEKPPSTTPPRPDTAPASDAALTRDGAGDSSCPKKRGTKIAPRIAATPPATAIALRAPEALRRFATRPR